jgi:hypothetical protein
MTNPGRPTSIESNNLEREFQKLYNRKIGAETAAKILVTNPKTAYKYYKKFSNQFKIITVKNLFTDGIDRIKQEIASFDIILIELWDSIDKINIQINQKSDKPLPPYLQNQKLSFLKEVRSIIKDKTLLELGIPINESVDEIVEEVLSNRETV